MWRFQHIRHPYPLFLPTVFIISVQSHEKSTYGLKSIVYFIICPDVRRLYPGGSAAANLSYVTYSSVSLNKNDVCLLNSCTYLYALLFPTAFLEKVCLE